MMDASQSQANSTLAVLLMDLRAFHRVNNAYGFAFGDQVLETLLVRLRGIGGKCALVERWGNDEFILIFNELSNGSLTMLAASEVLKRTREPVTVEGRKVWLQANIGWSVNSGDENAERLIQLAEHSVRTAQAQGLPIGMPMAGHPDLSERNAIDFEQDVQRAVESNDFQLYYQPKLNLNTMQIAGAEALVRWDHPELGILSPIRFLPTVDYIGGMGVMTQWAINTALKDFGQWPEMDGAHVSVNVSPNLVHDTNLLQGIAKALGIWCVSPESLVIEITEEAIMENSKGGIENLIQLRQMGVGVSIDDFGTGYSSLGYFHSLPASELKIDKMFCQNLSDPKQYELVEAIVKLARSAGFSIVVEGVEDVEAFNLVKHLGVDWVQGFLISRPLTQSAFINWVNAFKPTGGVFSPPTE